MAKPSVARAIISPRGTGRDNLRAVTGPELVSEGEAIAKPCFALSARGAGVPAAYWGGSRSDIPDEFPPEVTKFSNRRHIVTVAEALLARIGVDRLTLSLYEWYARDDGDPLLQVEANRGLPWGTIQFSGEPLYALDRTSFPPFEALCLHGSQRVADWLESLGLRRYEYWKVPHDLVREYERHYVARVGELYRDADVIVGGWHDMWPEDEYYKPPELTYVLRTLRDAEPWYTVWHSPMSKGSSARIHFS
jgi:hypothetical protein